MLFLIYPYWWQEIPMNLKWKFEIFVNGDRYSVMLMLVHRLCKQEICINVIKNYSLKFFLTEHFEINILKSSATSLVYHHHQLLIKFSSKFYHYQRWDGRVFRESEWYDFSMRQTKIERAVCFVIPVKRSLVSFQLIHLQDYADFIC